MNMATDLAALFERDLGRLAKQVENFPDDEAMWRTLPGITNSAGNLALHVEGNLREYVGRQIGNVPYQRQRDLEFSAKGFGRAELGKRLQDLKHLVPAIVGALTAERMEMEFPVAIQETRMSTRRFLMHLYGHLNWHVGQVDYLRRIIAGELPDFRKIG